MPRSLPRCPLRTFLPAVAASACVAGCLYPPASPTYTPASASSSAKTSSGFLLGSPMGVTSKHEPDIQVKAAGFTPGPPPNLPADIDPPAFDTLVQVLVQDLPKATTEAPLLAMSLGLDVIETNDVYITSGNFDESPPSPTGTYPVIELGKHGWYAIEFSVNSGELGASPDLAPDIATAEKRDGSVFCYVLPESSLDLLVSEQDSTRVLEPSVLGLSKVDDELHAINLHMGLYYTDLTTYPHVFTVRPLPTAPSVYFALRPEFVSAAGPTNIRGAWRLPAGTRVDAATIWRSDWRNGTWTLPAVYATAEQLGLPNADVKTYVFDGLALDTKATPSPADDELLYSLRETATVEVPPEEQIMHVVPGKPPRRPVLRKGNKYGTLGRQMRAGRGCGDFCTADPWVYANPDRTKAIRTAAAIAAPAIQQAPLLVDDFLVARRLVAGAMPSLAISGYRMLADTRPVMRMCAASPMRIPGARVATVRWGKMTDLTDLTTLTWDPHDQVQLLYTGRPFTFDRLLPRPGVLSHDPTVNPPPPPLQAFVMQWSVTVGPTTWYSPLAALRY
jgi:hypothetical protein